MPDYRSMYLALLHATEQAIDVLSTQPFPTTQLALRREVIELLAAGQQRCEEIYLSAEDAEESEKSD